MTTASDQKKRGVTVVTNLPAGKDYPVSCTTASGTDHLERYFLPADGGRAWFIDCVTAAGEVQGCCRNSLALGTGKVLTPGIETYQITFCG